MRGQWSVVIVGISLSLASCAKKEASPSVDLDQDPAAADGAVPAHDAGPLPCVDDEDCSDLSFCTGEERCVPAAPSADARGCIRGAAPCEVGSSCLEEARACKPCADDDDLDDDTVAGEACGGRDCDDRDANRFPGNPEVCNAHDEDCDPGTFGERDLDNDGFFDLACSNADGGHGTDCNDSNASVHPGLPEICNGVDDDCAGEVDDGLLGTYYPDLDGDEQGDRGEDEGEGDAGVDGGASTGVLACSSDSQLAEQARDCDDADPTRHQLQVELCDDRDNDCDDIVDENPSPVLWYRDDDGDGFGDARKPTEFSCFSPGSSWSILKRDCNDADPDVYPTAAEICDGKDNNCNGRADFFLGAGDYEDDDGDGKPDQKCALSAEGDCDDRDYTSYPGAPELCDARDNDCDGNADQGTEDVRWFVDVDRDGYGDDRSAVSSCSIQRGRVLRGGDCADTNPDQHPARLDDCFGEHGVDDDCDGQVDEAEQLVPWYLDSDGDLVGTDMPVLACDAPDQHVARTGDCASGDPLVHPGQTESCTDQVDNDCDGYVDCDDSACYAQEHCKVEAEILLVSGGAQTAPVGKLLGEPIRVRLREPSGRLLSAQPVTLSSTGGSGASEAGSRAITDANGVATFVVRAGRRVGVDYLRVSAVHARPLTVPLHVSEPSEGHTLTLLNAAKIAGTGLGAGQSAIATWSRPGNVWGVVSARDGTLYVSSPQDGKIYRLTTEGRLEHLAGGGSEVRDDVSAELTSMTPRGLALDESDAEHPVLYLADAAAKRVREIDLRTRVIHTVAGGGTAGEPDHGDGQAATSAQLFSPAELVLLGRTLYVTDTQVDRMRKVDLDRAVIDAVRTEASAGLTLCACTLGCAIASSPQGELFLAARAVGSEVQDPDGQCSDTRATAIVRIDAEGGLHHVAGKRLGAASDGLSALSTTLPNAISLAFDPAGNLYYGGDARVRRIDGTTSVVRTVLGDGTAGTSGDHGDGTPRIRSATDLTFFGTHLLVADASGASLRSVWGAGSNELATITGLLESSATMSGQVLRAAGKLVVRVLDTAGAPVAQARVSIHSSEGAHAETAFALTGPDGRASSSVWPGRALESYVFEAVTETLHGQEAFAPLRVTLTGTAPPVNLALPLVNVSGSAPVLAADGRVVNGVPGPAVAARIGTPHALATAGDGTLYVSSTSLQAVYTVSPRGHISLLAGSGNGTAGASGDGGLARQALLNTPNALALDETRDLLYVSESGNRSIRAITLGAAPTIDFVVGVNRVLGLAVDAAGNLYVAKETEHASDGFMRMDAQTHALEVVLPGGTSVPGETRFLSCQQNCAVAVDAGGRLVISGYHTAPVFDGSNASHGSVIARWLPGSGPALEYLAGGPWRDDPNAPRPLMSIRSLAAFGDAVYFAEPDSQAVGRWAEGVFSKIAGEGAETGHYVTSTQLRLTFPEGVLVTPDGHVVIAETGSSKVRLLWGMAAP